MKFKYQARTKDGQLQVGYVEGPSKDMASSILLSHDLFVLSIESTEKKSLKDSLFGFLGRVKAKDLMIFTNQLSALIDSELSLSKSLRVLSQQTINEKLRNAAFEMANDIESGLAFSQALERQKPIFSDFFISMIRSAEVTGRLEQALAFLSGYVEKDVAWKSKINGALMYPAVLIALFTVVGGIMVVTVFPKIKAVFTESGAELPMVSKIVFGAGDFLAQWWWMVLIVLGGIVFILTDYFRSEEGKSVLGAIILKLPVFGNLFRKIYIVRFSQSFSVLIQGGIPMTQAIEISGDTITNEVYRELFHNIAQGVREGSLFSQLLLTNERYFPPMVGQMAAIGETTGRLDAIMQKIADFYEREVNNVMNNLSELIQPMLILVMGVLVGILFAAILSPIYNLASTFTA